MHGVPTSTELTESTESFSRHARWWPNGHLQLAAAAPADAPANEPSKLDEQ